MTKYIMASLVFVVGCETSINASKSEITTSFLLKDSRNTETTRFGFGQDINFYYAIENGTPNNYSYTNQDTGPLTVFEIYKGDSLIGSSVDGFFYIPLIVEGTLQSDDTLTVEYSWLSVNLHAPLPLGDYIAKARPRLDFDDIENPVLEELNFRIIAMSDLVKISDLPPDSIQLDRFDLNSITISGDEITLNLSYSGGCEEHEFELFMSPGSFMESNPVQANLFLRHNDKDDACDAYLTTEVTFDLSRVAELYQQFYGQKDEIILNVFDYFQGQPGNHLSGSYFP